MNTTFLDLKCSNARHGGELKNAPCGLINSSRYVLAETKAFPAAKLSRLFGLSSCAPLESFTKDAKI